ncbi:MAG: cytochrome c3 family protein [Bacillota bacterium]
MWKKSLGQACTYVITTAFVVVFALIVVSGVLFGVILFARTAFASSGPSTAEVTNDVCLTCHGEKSLSVDKNGKNISLYVDQKLYEASKHGKQLCVSCHPDLKLIPHGEWADQSEISMKASSSCGNCHDRAAKDYQESIHKQTGATNQTTPNCGSCHTVHNGPGNAEALLPASKAESNARCTSCHSDYVMLTYGRSFHGSAVKLGSSKTAGCIDCHGNHKVLPQENPESAASVNNLPRTCANCHGVESPNWAVGKEHVVPEDKTNALPLWIALKIFLVIILIDILKDGGIVILELMRQWREVARNRRRQHDARPDRHLGM